MSMTEIVLGER